MKIKSGWLLALLIALAPLLMAIPVSADETAPPHAFYGTVAIGGSPAPVGTVVKAKVGGVERGSITTTVSGQYGGSGAFDAKLTVSGDIANGSTISFYINDAAANETYAFFAGAVTQLNLTGADTAPPSVTITALTPDPTNDNTPTFTGTATDALSNISTVEYRVDAGSWTAATASDGSFNSLSESYTFTTSALGDGAHTVYVRATDAGSNTTASANYATDTFTIDTAAPAAPSVALTSPISGLNKTSVAITGTGEASASVSYSITSSGGGTAVTGTGTVSGGGAISITGINVSGLGDGTVTASVTVTDAAGNGSAAGTATATKDTVAPAAPSITVTSPINAANKTNVAITGTGEANASVSYSITSSGGGTAVIGTGAVSGGGAISITGINVSGLGDGTVTASVTVSDAAGNASAAGTATATKEAVEPTVALTSTASPATKVSPIPVTATFSETVTGFVAGDVTVGNGAAGNFVAVSGTVYTFDVTPTAQGAVTVNVAAGVAQDAAGNDNTAATQLSITYDSIAPGAPSGLSAPAYVNNANKAAYAVTGTAEAGSTVTVTITDSAFATATGTGTATGGSFSINVNATSLAEGPVSITATATDSAGNISVASAALIQTKDTVAPSVTINAVTTPTEASVQTLTGTMEAGATVALTSATATFGAVSYPTATTWSSQATLGQGSNSITATASDAAGNTAAASITVFLTPSVTISSVISPTNAAAQTLTGTRTTGATVTLSSPTATFGAVSYPTTTTWSAVATLAEGTNTITATVAGMTATVTIVLDTVAPAVLSVSPSNGATNIAVTSVVTATFSKDMDASTITTSSFTLTGSAVPGAVTYNSATRTATFTPTASLTQGVTYTATLSTAVKDSVGNPLAAAYSWSFTTVLPALADTIAPVAAGGTVQLEGDKTYSGNLTITKPITITGGAGTVVKGGIKIAPLTGSNVTIENLTVMDYTDFGLEIEKVKAGDIFIIRNNVFQGAAGSVVGILVDEVEAGGTLTIEKNTITGNQVGIKLLAAVATGTVQLNDITSNSTAGLQVVTGGTATAVKNWWGNISGPKQATTNPGGTGGTITGSATYQPWLTRGFQTAVTDNIAYYGYASVQLAAGWNMMSVPIAPDAAADTWGEYVALGDGLGIHATNPAYRFDAQTQTWVALTSSYQLTPGDAIYVRMAQADVAPILYSPNMSVPTKQLYAGWNLVGLASTSDMSVKTALTSAYKAPGDLTGYSQVVSPSIGNQTSWAYMRDAVSEPTMQATKGYWVFMVNAPSGTTLGGFTFTPITLSN